MEDVYFKISEIASMYNTSIRALRLYDKIDLFKPTYTDETTGYRYYTIDQFPKLNTILVFKSIGIKLIDIKNLMDNGVDPEHLLLILKERQSYWENQIDIAKFNIDSIKNLSKSLECDADKLKNENQEPDAYKMSRLVCLENIKVSNILTEALWL